MKKQKIAMTSEQADRLMSEVLAHPDGPESNNHLSTDEFILYSLEEELRPEEKKKIELHLFSCSDCLAEMERLIEANEAWRGSRGERRLKRVRAEVLRKVSAIWFSPDPSSAPPFGMSKGIRLLPDLALYGARAGATMDAVDDHALGGALRWRIVEDEANNILVRFSSNDSALCGTQLELTAGHWRRIVAMISTGPEQVCAETKITRKEREQLRGDAPLRLDFYVKDIYDDGDD